MNMVIGSHHLEMIEEKDFLMLALSKTKEAVALGFLHWTFDKDCNVFSTRLNQKDFTEMEMVLDGLLNNLKEI